MKRNLMVLSLIFIGIQPLSGQSMIEIGPDVDVYFLQFNLGLSKSDKVILGGVYLNTRIAHLIPYPGDEEIFALEAGYRRYLWEGLNLDVLCLPQWVHCIEKPSGMESSGLGLTGEVRLGYEFSFETFGVNWTLNLQWFAGYHFINPKPESFKSVDGGNFYTSPIPMFLFGVRF